jgi:hypothetical protein
VSKLVAHKHIMAIAKLEQFNIVIKLAIDIEPQVKYIKLAKYMFIKVVDTITHTQELATQLKV